MFETDPRIDRVHGAVLDAALDSYPLAPVPAGLIRRALARLEPHPKIRYRLEFIDLAVPVFLVLFLLLTVWAAFWTLNYVSPYWMLEWATQLEIGRQWFLFKAMRLPAWLPVLVAIFGGISFVGVGFIAILLIERSFLALRLKHG